MSVASQAATNYTVTTKIVAADRNGQEVAQPDDTYAYTQFFGTANALTEVTTVTAEGIESVLKDGDKVLKKIAFFNHGGKAYEVSGALNAQDEMEYTSKELTGDSAVASAEAAVYTTAAFTDAAIDAGLWTKKVAKNDGTYLITKRDDNKDVYPGYWEATAGGSAIKGEEPFEAAQRELFEETGLKGVNYELINVSFSDKSHSMFYSYVCETDAPKDTVSFSEELSVSSSS